MAIKLPSSGSGGGLTNGAIVNGVALFFGTVPPSTRVDGSPLVDGDLFYEKGVGNWFYKNPYWVSADLEGVSILPKVISSSGYQPFGSFSINSAFFLETLSTHITGNNSSQNTVSTYIRLQGQVSTSSNQQILNLGTFVETSILGGSSGSLTVTQQLNSVIPWIGGRNVFGCQSTETGNSQVTVGFSVSYRRIRP